MSTASRIPGFRFESHYTTIDDIRLHYVDEGRAIAKMVPNGRFHLIEGAGHYLQEDAGEQIVEIMIPFLRDEAKSSEV